ncbi:MAG: hypothetical protein M3081_16030 [Gemmatimonadota bacterium]|nr:hypothetical protein [Gemmatimonadota bacterium]
MNKVGIVLGGVALVVLFVGVFISYRMRVYSRQRATAGERGSQALLEMNILTHQLAQQAKTKEIDPALAMLPPGERLQRLYPGVRPRAQSVSSARMTEPEEAS